MKFIQEVIIAMENSEIVMFVFHLQKRVYTYAHIINLDLGVIFLFVAFYFENIVWNSL